MPDVASQNNNDPRDSQEYDREDLNLKLAGFLRIRHRVEFRCTFLLEDDEQRQMDRFALCEKGPIIICWNTDERTR